MKLNEAIISLDSIDESLTIYAEEPWTCDSKVMLALEPEDGGLPEGITKDSTYFLEIIIAKEVIEGWKSNLEYIPSIEESCKRLIDYAVNDA